MIEINATLFTLLIEGFAFACMLLVITAIVSARRKGKDRKALRALVADINNEAGARLERTKALLPEGESAKTLSRHERGVCQAFIGAYDKRAADSVTDIYAALKTLVDAYQQEMQQRRESQAAEQRAGDDDSKPTPKDAVISKLKSDYEQTARELEITKRTMEKMVREYSSMFAGGSGAEQGGELDAEEILQRMKAEMEAADDADRDGAAEGGAVAEESEGEIDELAAALDIAAGDSDAASGAASTADAAAMPLVTRAEDDEAAVEPEAVLEFVEEDTEEEPTTTSAA